MAHPNAKGISALRNDTLIQESTTVMGKNPELKDRYNDRNPYKVTPQLLKRDESALAKLSDEERALLNKDFHYYEMTFENVGGLVMPIILEFKYEDGTSEIQHIPAEIWKQNSSEVSKVFITEKPIREVELDPYLETADTDRANNYYPARKQPSRFELYNGGRY